MMQQVWFPPSDGDGLGSQHSVDQASPPNALTQQESLDDDSDISDSFLNEFLTNSLGNTGGSDVPAAILQQNSNLSSKARVEKKSELQQAGQSQDNTGGGEEKSDPHSLSDDAAKDVQSEDEQSDEQAQKANAVVDEDSEEQPSVLSSEEHKTSASSCAKLPTRTSPQQNRPGANVDTSKKGRGSTARRKRDPPTISNSPPPITTAKSKKANKRDRPSTKLTSSGAKKKQKKDPPKNG